MASATRLHLYIWPGEWGLPSVDAHCLAAALYLQLVAPGRFSLVESADADSAPHGQLPYLVNGEHRISGFAAIVKYLDNTLDDQLSATETATSLAWRAYIDLHCGNLLAHSLFAVGPNYYPLTHTMLATHLPVPQRYYVPQRLRTLYRPRLEDVAMWDIGHGEEEKEKEKASREDAWTRAKKSLTTDDASAKVRLAFGRERVLEKARDALDPLARLLDSRDFIYQHRPTSIDLLLAAHVLLLVDPPYPDPLIGTLITESYPSLAAHARLILSLAFPTPPGPSHVPPQILFAPDPSLVYMPRTLLASSPPARFATFLVAGLGAVALVTSAMRTIRTTA
ncbi:hypothetical protein EXIGLDRAFT_764775 [Exidia glandulosa HHB12029]|uniref:GST N-terminal domain-containing protein n=1 Tax=Exidia glandulosa HHB12029 TaxID=1314781 RepID=A0A165KWX8_EXIGL|nr:hypothetical protein EXIGLDRAFT_764775 [Exidia glandulosa HHB12029]